jgi:hypothetical protein
VLRLLEKLVQTSSLNVKLLLHAELGLTALTLA